jgi:hypothetical protein
VSLEANRYQLASSEAAASVVTKNMEIHSHNTRSANNLLVPTANITKYKKGTHYTGSKIFNHLPNRIKNLANEKKVF